MGSLAGVCIFARLLLTFAGMPPQGNLSEFVKVRPEARSYYELSAAKIKFNLPKPGFLDGVKSRVHFLACTSTQFPERRCMKMLSRTHWVSGIVDTIDCTPSARTVSWQAWFTQRILAPCTNPYYVCARSVCRKSPS